MRATKNEIREELAVLVQEQAETQANLLRVRELLERADQRKKDNPEEARNWNKKLDRLEETLLREKSRLARCEQDIVAAHRNLEDIERKQEAPAPDAPGEDTFEGATRRALAHQEEDTVDASLEEAALVRTALESREEARPEDHITRALARRVEQYKSEPDAARETQRGLRRKQHLLRDAIEKCVSDQIGTVTLDEIHLLTNCYAIVRERDSESEEDRRLSEVLEQAIARLYENCGSLIEIHDSMSSTSDSP